MPGFDTGSVLYALNVDFTGNSLTSGTAQMLLDGQLLIGSSVAPHIRVATLTQGSGVTITNSNGSIEIGLTGGGSAVETLTGNSGTASPSSNNINIETANTTVKFVGSTPTLTQDFGLSNLMLGSAGSAITSATHTASVGDTALTAITSGGSNSALGYAAGSGITTGASNTLLGASAGSNYTSSESNNIIIGAGVPGTAAESNVIRMGQSASTGFQLTGMNSLFFHNFGTNNLFIGISAGNQTLSGANNLGLGLDALNALTSGGSNVALGRSALAAMTSGTNSVAIGVNSLLTISTNSNCVGVGYQTLKLATGGTNTAVGTNALSAVTSGTGNTCVGYTAGQNYISTESNNICIGNGVLGTVTESTTTRIGNAQTACYITGIDGVNVGSVAKVVTEASNQLGTATITAGTGISVVATANTITINNTGEGFTWTDESLSFNAASSNGYFCTATLTATLPASPSQGNAIAFVVDSASGILTITANTGQKIQIGSAINTATAGTAASNKNGDSVTLIYRASDAIWFATSVIGTWTLS